MVCVGLKSMPVHIVFWRWYVIRIDDGVWGLASAVVDGV